MNINTYNVKATLISIYTDKEPVAWMGVIDAPNKVQAAADAQFSFGGDYRLDDIVVQIKDIRVKVGGEQ
jgi:hypothetical protein